MKIKVFVKGIKNTIIFSRLRRANFVSYNLWSSWRSFRNRTSFHQTSFLQWCKRFLSMAKIHGDIPARSWKIFVIFAMVQAPSTIGKTYFLLDFCAENGYWRKISINKYRRDSRKLENEQNRKEIAPQARRKIGYFWRKSGKFWSVAKKPPLLLTDLKQGFFFRCWQKILDLRQKYPIFRGACGAISSLFCSFSSFLESLRYLFIENFP